jgi:hypothetical protein
MIHNTLPPSLTKWIFFFLFPTFFSFGQTNHYNFSTKKASEIYPLNFKEPSVYRVENINKYIYEVIITAKHKTYISEAPKIFDTYFEIKRESKIKEETDKATGGTTKEEEIKEAAEAESEVYKYNQVLEQYKGGISNPELFQKVLSDSSWTSKIELYKDVLEAKQKEEKDLELKVSDPYEKSLLELKKRSYSLSKSYEDLEDCKDIKNALLTLIEHVGLTYQSSIASLEYLGSQFIYFYKVEGSLSSYYQAYNEYKAYYSDFAENPDVLQKFNDDKTQVETHFKKMNDEIDSTNKKVASYDYNSLFKEVSKLKNNLADVNTFSAVSNPIQSKGDAVVFKIEIKPRKSYKKFDHVENRSFDIEVPVHGGLKISFSTGIFGVLGLTNKSYSLNPVIGDTTMVKISEDNNNNVFSPSLGALMHATRRGSPVAFTFGLGTNSTDLSKAEIFTGASIVFGKREKLILSGGIALSQVDYLKGKYELEKEYEKGSLNETITEKTWRVGTFISITYNLTKVKVE